MGFVGGSITNAPSWADDVCATIATREAWRDVRLYRDAKNGKTSWDHASTLQGLILDKSPYVVVLDHAANNQNENIYKFQAEGEIRRIRTALPNAWIVMALFGYWNADTPTDTEISNGPEVVFLRQQAQRYDVEVWDNYVYMKNLIEAAQATLDDWHTAPDYVHPDTAGDLLFAGYLDARLTQAKLNGTAAQWTGNLADYSRVNAESAEYETGGIARNGVSNDGETGSWSTVGTARASSTPDSTMTFTGTFTSFGLDAKREPGQGVVAWQLDGGAWTNLGLSTYVVYPQVIQHIGNPAAAHTVTFKVVSGNVQINRFLAI